MYGLNINAANLGMPARQTAAPTPSTPSSFAIHGTLQGLEDGQICWSCEVAGQDMTLDFSRQFMSPPATTESGFFPTDQPPFSQEGDGYAPLPMGNGPLQNLETSGNELGSNGQSWVYHPGAGMSPMHGIGASGYQSSNIAQQVQFSQLFSQDASRSTFGPQQDITGETDGSGPDFTHPLDEGTSSVPGPAPARPQRRPVVIDVTSDGEDPSAAEPLEAAKCSDRTFRGSSPTLNTHMFEGHGKVLELRVEGKCPKCEFRGEKLHVKNHVHHTHQLDLESKEIGFICAIPKCGKVFLLRADLVRHHDTSAPHKTTLDDGSFECNWPHCNDGPFSSNNEFTVHFNTEHFSTARRARKQMFHCTVEGCKRKGALGFKRRDQLTAHRKRKHSELHPPPERDKRKSK